MKMKMMRWVGVMAVMLGAGQVVRAEGVLKVVATVPDLGGIAREVGGEAVAVTVLGKGAEDPHFIEAKPSYIKAVSEADVFLEVGLDLEVGYAPVLLNNARNARVLGN